MVLKVLKTEEKLVISEKTLKMGIGYFIHESVTITILGRACDAPKSFNDGY